MVAPQEGVIRYSSGNTAVVVTPCEAGQVVTVYTDDANNPKVLSMFDNKGIGFVCYKNGKPWLVVTQAGWKVSDRQGSILEQGRGVRNGEEIRCEPTEHLLVTFRDRRSWCSLTFDCDGVRHTWDCSEHLKRSDSHLDKVVGTGVNGKLQLDIEAIRARQADTGSVYVSKGPHSYVTQHTGLGSLKKALQSVRPGGPVQAAVQQLQASDSRIKLINTLPCPVYGTARLSDKETTSLAFTRLPDLTTSANSLTNTAKSVSSPLLADYGAPAMSAKQRRWQKAGQSWGKPAAFKSTRLKLESMTMDNVKSQVLSGTALRDTLYCICLMADWNPGCARLMPKLEEGYAAIHANTATQPGTPTGVIKVLKVDASEGNWLQNKYVFKSVPMFLMFFQGHLVYADNNISSGAELQSACARALVLGRKSEYLPDSYRFGQVDNSLLNSITPLMTLSA